MALQWSACLLCVFVSLSFSLDPLAEWRSVSQQSCLSERSGVGAVRHLRGSTLQGAMLPAARLRGGNEAAADDEGTRKAWQPLNADQRASFEDAMKRRFFYTPSFSIYGGVSGLYDYGPPGQAVKKNMLAAWRDFFVVEEGMLEVSCSSVTPKEVLDASGHVARFTDLMVRDEATGDCFRADKLLEESCEEKLQKSKDTGSASQVEKLERMQQEAGGMDADELHAALQALNISSPTTGNLLSKPFPFNLMFQTSIGPTGTATAYLRPETAQGIFTNFRRLLDYNGGRLPFAVAQIGKAFRNEIAPKQGLLRVREFEMAEIEHFLPRGEARAHAKFSVVAELQVAVWSAGRQQEGMPPQRMALGEAVAQGVVCNEALGYFLGRTVKFLQLCGVEASAIRLRQHTAREMAHYADDCWDAEVLTSYGWIELVGHADRACFDLKVHSEASGTPLVAFETFPTPVYTPTLVATIHKAVLGKAFKRRSAAVVAELEGIVDAGGAAAEALKEALETAGTASIAVEGEATEVTSAMVSVALGSKKETGVSFHPHVVEPSFGLDRLFYSLLEHSFYVRPSDEQRSVLGLPAFLAPYQCAIMALVQTEDTAALCASLLASLRRQGLSCRVDDSAAAIGRRYARMDMIGVPFALTLDADTPSDHSLTVRERDSMAQIRLPLSDAPALLAALCSLPHLDGHLSWAQAAARFATPADAPPP